MRAVAAAVLALLAAAAPAAAAPPRVAFDRLGTFDEPVYVAGAPGRPGTLAVVERYGKVRLVVRGRVRRRPLLDLSDRVLVRDPRPEADQRGLLSLAFAPDWATSGLLYVDYVDRDGRVRVDEWRRGERTTRRVLDLGPAATTHHGGQLQFGPDGLLYVSTGVGDAPLVAQDPAHPGGKLLRLDPRQDPARPEVVALGLRNPWRFAFDRATGDLLIGDVGGSRAEEVDRLPAGAPLPANFGWPYFEGRRRRAPGGPENVLAPALEHRHGAGWCGVIGGYAVRARPRALRGRYLYGDLCTGRLWSARVTSSGLGRPRRLPYRVPYLVSFGEDALGRVYAVSLLGGVWRLG
jgi:glucose/arabinose dehydrogenase